MQAAYPPCPPQCFPSGHTVRVQVRLVPVLILAFSISKWSLLCSCRDLIKKLLVVDRTRRLGSMKVSHARTFQFAH